MTISGNLIDIHQRRIYPATVSIESGKIASVTEDAGPYSNHLLPGFIDAHIHIESSMLTPVAFARMAVTHGSVATVSDPQRMRQGWRALYDRKRPADKFQILLWSAKLCACNIF